VRATVTMRRRQVGLAALALLLAGVAAAQAQVPAEELAAPAKAAVAMIHGKLQVHGLRQAVHVQRDHWGVAHIYAQNQHDLFFAQGFVVAQDRLFQMELWKRSGQGRLAEVLGAGAVARDINARLLGYRGDMEAEYRSYAADTKEILEAFTSGINTYIEETKRPGGPGLPIEFQIAGFRPEAWKPEDCLNRMAAYSMTGNAESELYNAQLVALLGAEKAAYLLELDPPVKLDQAPGADFSGLSPALLEHLVGSDMRMEFPPKALEGSNNWTVSGALTATGKPLLANDPHRVMALPSLRYIVHLVAPGWNVIGAGEPGLPGIAAGHNEKIAWGFTIFGLDQQDLYLEQLNPADPEQYRTENGWRRMEVRTESIGIRGAAPQAVKLKFTRHGPVLWEDGKRALALRWVGAEPGTAGYLGSLALDRAQNWKEFEEAMKRWKVPSENIVYADSDGKIGEHSTGLAPLRKNWTGLLPMPGSGGYEWAGYVPNEDLPHTYDPAAGFMATANHKTIPEKYAYAVGFEWASPERYLRIKEVLEQAKNSGHKLSLADMEALQTDVISLPARELQGLLRHAAGASPSAAANLLLDWDCALATDSAAAALYEFWAAELQAAVTDRAVPAKAREAAGKLSLWRTVKELTRPRAAVFGDNPGAARDALLLAALSSAENKLAAKQGSDAKKWSWGELHRARFLHALDQARGAAALFDRGPVQRPGDSYTVNATYSRDQDFVQSGGASYREIFDLSDWDKSLGINVPGQSGQPGSKHYDDLLPLWSEGRYFPLSYTKTAVDRVTEDVLELTP